MGSLEIIMGPMFSGKTEMLIKKYNTVLELDLDTMFNHTNVVAYNYYKDTRYGNDKIVSHNGKSINSTNIKTLSQIFDDTNKLINYTHIFINEAQFFSDLKECVIKLVEEYNKHVIICGLDCDYKRDKFGDMWDLIPYADSIVKLKGICNICSNPSLFTHRITREKEQEIIGNDNYEPLCRICYKNKTNCINDNVSVSISK